MSILAAIAACSLAIGACRGDGKTPVQQTAAQRPQAPPQTLPPAQAGVTDSAAGDVARDSTPATVTGRWITDANALSLLGTMNARQIAAADVELGAWHVDSVRAFAAAIARQHAEIQHSLDSLADRLHLVPVAPALAATISTAMQAQIDSLAGARGTGLDRAFLRQQLSSLALFTDYAQRLSAVAQAPEMQTLMSAAAGRSAAQLERARTLQSRLAVADSAAADSAARRATRRKS